MKKRIIPFRLLPAAWGLRGDVFKVAEASYYHEGEQLDRELAAIQYKADAEGLKRQLLELDYRYGHIDTYNYDVQLAALECADNDALLLRKVEVDVIHQKITPYEGERAKVAMQHPAGLEREVAYLEVEHRFNRLSKHEYDKQRATLLDEPWIAIINSGFDPERGIDGVFFEFDWNSKWVEFLKLNGYVGRTDDQIVDDWFSDVCRSHSAAELAGSLAPSHNLHRD